MQGLSMQGSSKENHPQADVYNILMWKMKNLSTFPSFPHKNVILFLSEGKVYTFPAKSKKNLYTFPAKCILFLLSVKRISVLL